MLEMFERLLAALIILALLVLVMFIALPYPTGGDRTSTPAVDQPPHVDPAAAPPETAREKPPAAGQENVANNDTVPQQPEKPAAEVPNPPGNKSGDNANKAPAPVPAPVPAPAPAEKAQRENGGGSDTQAKQKFVKTYQDKLPAGDESPPKPAAAKGDKPAPEEKPKAAKPKDDKLKTVKPKTETASRAPVRQPQPRVYIKDDGDRSDGIGDYIRRTDSGPSDWHRTHYYECADGRCDCSCDRPYWARRGPPCWD